MFPMKNIDPQDSLLAKRPDLAKEWSELNPKTPDMISYGSDFMACWCCSLCGHFWKSTVNNRTHGSVCPKCATLKSERKIGDLLSEIVPNFGLEIVPQYRVTINNSRHFYDFALTKESKTVAFVEYDGVQHYRPVRFGGMSDEKAEAAFEKTK